MTIFAMLLGWDSSGINIASACSSSSRRKLGLLQHVSHVYVWSLALIILLLRSRCAEWPSLREAMFILLIASALVCLDLFMLLHYCIPSKVVELQRLAIVLLSFAVFIYLESDSISALLLRSVLGPYVLTTIALPDP